MIERVRRVDVDVDVVAAAAGCWARALPREDAVSVASHRPITMQRIEGHIFIP